MILYLVGVGCVGKTTIGRLLANKLGCQFYDVDEEVERYYNKPIEKIQNESFSMNGYREKASIVLDRIFTNNIDMVIAGTPSGLKYAYLSVSRKHKKNKNINSIHVMDEPKNILSRIEFYDIDSNPITVILDEKLGIKYMRAINSDYNFFKDSYKRADIQIDISNLALENIPLEIIKRLKLLNEVLASTLSS